MHWFTATGANVAIPIGHSPHWDLIAEWNNRVVRVQVKTSGCFRKGRWEITVCTRGGNRSWSGTVKRFSPARCDFLFVLVADGRRWLIPAEEVGGGSGLRLGGPKYERFEIERDRPFERSVAVLAPAV